ncbi:UDP-glucuronate 4-epimerase [Novosphingobium sp. Rr 2-17]|uniref:NAD-dependent epimerase/dehydratase family protein n=1 Tax=Novosphingobium sp. Rr 2-17 TaxID=555793 RepID=UPI0002697AEC|nr:NAD-dependent epimerase/dehydratase family protein [Novosphingobium sp. Rr 2-17]EIZ81188.1 UDP-glucuronate 4-epimerase [Novosphingobium sp. Rr 2-17]
MTILVTGAAGFIGSQLCKSLLARGDEVLGIDNLSNYYQVKLKHDRLSDIRDSVGGNDRFNFKKVDFSDDTALDDCLRDHAIDRIVHLGAQAGVRYSIENPRAYAKSNLVGHLNILELARSLKVRHLVYASSSSVYGNNVSLPFAVEDRVDYPVSLYAATKRSDELMSETYSHLYRIPQTGLRFFTVYGPWGRPDMAPWLFTSAILEGRPIKVFNHGDMMRDFTFIDDIIAGVIAALDNPPLDDGQLKAGGSRAPHRLYNIGNNRAERLDDFIAVIENACGREAIRDYQPMQPGDVPATYADISAIQGDLNYSPSTSIQTGIPQFVTWYGKYTDDSLN